MELKLSCSVRDNCFFFVLIVPSGIETCLIEYPFSFLIVLIVPSGIETKEVENFYYEMIVLIVPSGIETKVVQALVDSVFCINCT